VADVNQDATTLEGTAVLLPPDSIGARLVHARQQLGLSAQQCAERLCVELRVVNALESEQFATVGANVYVRGHLRRYAALVNENVAELEQLLARHAGMTQPPDLTAIATQPFDPPKRAPRIGLLPVALLAIALALAALVRWAVTTTTASSSTSVTIPLPVTVPANSSGGTQ
jgi:cytoskeleton protein RodZ